MKFSKTKTAALVLLAVLAGIAFLNFSGTNSLPGLSAGIDLSKSVSPAPSVSAARVREAYGKLPLAFELNRGQADPAINFSARGEGYMIALSPTAAALVLAGGTPGRGVRNRAAETERAPLALSETQAAVLRINFVGANPAAPVRGEDELEGKVNYLMGSDPSHWRTNIPTFGRVHYSEVYPGIDLIYYGSQRRLEYDFLVAPGHDPRTIALEFAGAESLEVETRSGDLLVGVEGRIIRQQKPIVYQEINGARREIESRYAMRGDQRVGFEVGVYDRRAALVIDPVLVYSTFLGGTEEEFAWAITVDSAGNSYVTGRTRSSNFPTLNPVQGTKVIFTLDAFVTKLNASGSALIYSTYLGGNGDDEGLGIAVDPNGEACLVGITSSSNFPVANPFQQFLAGGSRSIDTFVTRLNSEGSGLVYSTYLGGTEHDLGFGIALDPAGNAYVTGDTRSTNFPTANAFQPSSNAGNGEVFVTKFNPAGSALVYSTYLGGTGADAGAAIAVDAAGNAYVTGSTASSNFPRANAFQDTFGGSADAFVTKINAAGTALVYSTYLGGSGLERVEGKSIALDSAGSVYVTGQTNSTNFPVANSFQSTLAGGTSADAYVTKLNAAGSALLYSTYLGGTDFEFPYGIAVDSVGNAYVAGHTASTNFPTVDPFQNINAGSDDTFITKLNAAGSALLYSSYLGGESSETPGGIAVDSAGNAYVTGFTLSICFPSTIGAFDTIQNDGFFHYDAFVTKISETEPAGSLARCKGQLVNIATRMRVLTGDSALIGGFIITGNEPKRVIIRGIGPSLSAVGIQDVLENPTLELFDANQISLGSNDDWRSNQAEVEATTIPPSEDLESAIVKTLQPGAYTAVLRGKDNSSGIGVVEIYDLNPGANAILANISSRGFVDTGDNAMIGGVIVGGDGAADTRVAVRGIGPSLAAFGITGALQNPTLELKNASGTTLMSNDDWQQGQPDEINQLKLAPSDSRESALVATLPHGNYTAILRGKDNTTGIGVVEVYNVP